MLEFLRLTDLFYRLTDGVKVSSCFHTGFFIVKSLHSAVEKVKAGGADVVDATEQFDLFADDFCTNYRDVLPMRTDFVKEIYQLEDEAAFGEACTGYLTDDKHKTLNTWFDPIDPLSSITQ